KNVALTVHGDAIVNGTLSADDIKTGTLDADHINLDSDYMTVSGSKVSIGGLTTATTSKLLGNKLEGQSSGTTTMTLKVSHTCGSTTSITGISLLAGRSGDTSDDSASWSLSFTDGMGAFHLIETTSSSSIGSVDGITGSIPDTAGTGEYSMVMSTTVSGIWDARLSGVFSIITSKR
ncbi:MAG: hypothetical protein U9R49_06845, partial [Bacteroidota bacterium]|nr:hypothetical protein [Bacteroidota bacterium]